MVHPIRVLLSHETRDLDDEENDDGRMWLRIYDG